LFGLSAAGLLILQCCAPPSVILTHAASFTGSPKKLGAQRKRHDAQDPKDDLPCRSFDFYSETLKLNRTLGLSKKYDNCERDNCGSGQAECRRQRRKSAGMVMVFRFRAISTRFFMPQEQHL
jgi:hypothetical protein